MTDGVRMAAITADRSGDELGLVATRRLLDGATDVRFRLLPGDRALVAPGESVVPGAPIAERLRDPRLLEIAVPAGAGPEPGGRITEGEILFEWKGHWRVAASEMSEPIETPVAGIVREVHTGSSIVVRASGRSMRGIVAVGGPTRGRLHVMSASDGELRAGGLDVALAGSILVVHGRVDAETLTRSRAMGLRGVIVAGMASKERRDFVASERRQRAALHRLPPYAVLVLEGALRRPLPQPMMAVLNALAGREVAISTDPPALLFDADDAQIPAAPPDLVRIRAGDLAGRDGRWAGSLGPRRFPGGVHLEAAAVRLDDGRTVAVPIGDLERFV
jgi:hypothetical protein